MSYVITTDVFCDVCGTWDENNRAGGDRPLKAIARFLAKRNGWIRQDGQDLCPKCQPHFSLEESDE